MSSVFYLGGGDSLRGVLENRKRSVRQEIEAFDSDYVLGASVDQLADHLADKHSIESPKINEEGIEISQHETQVERGDPFGRGTFSRPAIAYELHIPFSGSNKYFSLQASTYSMSPPRIRVEGEVIVASVVDGSGLSPEQLRAELDSIKNRIAAGVGWLHDDIERYNGELKSLALEAIRRRRERLLAAQNTVESLGFKLKARPGEAKSITVPTVRKKLHVARPVASPPGSKPEPPMPMTEYGMILETLRQMVLVMERSPAAFRTLGEEELRTHFLVGLNGVFEGGATAETFNYEGKTDITIHYEGRNLFVAECKIWHGPEELLKALDQLLGYVTWRDTKAALLIFNRNKNFSAVIAKIRETTRKHPNFVRESPDVEETGIRLVMRHRDDASRELYVTIIAFDVPT